MKKIILWIQSFMIGLAKITPGVSGSVLALSFGLYDRGIEAISCFFKDIKSHSKFLLFTGSGIFCAIVFGSQMISFLLQYYYIPTMFFFIGTIVGGIKPLWKQIKIDLSIKNITFMIVIVIIILVLSRCITPNVSFLQLPSFVLYMLVGIIDAATMIIPGISGTAIMMSLGLYPILLSCFSSFIHWSLIYSNLPKLVFYILGLMIGAFIVSLIMNYLFSHYRKTTYIGIFFLSLLSMLMLVKDLVFAFSWQPIFLLSITLFFLGYKMSRYFE